MARFSYSLFSITTTDAQDVSVITEPRVTLQMGSRGLLPCSFDREVAWITWSKGPTETTTYAVIVYESTKDGWKKWGPGYGKGYDVEENFSLVIQDVAIDDAGYFFCEVLDKGTSLSFVNQTDVNVFGKLNLVKNTIDIPYETSKNVIQKKKPIISLIWYSNCTNNVYTNYKAKVGY